MAVKSLLYEIGCNGDGGYFMEMGGEVMKVMQRQVENENESETGQKQK